MGHVILAVCRLTEASDERVQALASALGVTPYEARPRVQPPAPRVVAVLRDAEEARPRVAALQAAGFEPLTLDSEGLGYGVQRLSVRTFELQPDRVHLVARSGDSREIRHEEIRLLLAGIATSIHRETTNKTKRKFDAGRALMSGGLMFTKNKRVRETRVSEETRAFLEVRAVGHPPLLLWEDELQYQGLGDALQASRAANHRRLVQELRDRAPTALYDDRLASAVGRNRVLGGILSPEDHLLVALDLLTAYYARGGADAAEP